MKISASQVNSAKCKLKARYYFSLIRLVRSVELGDGLGKWTRSHMLAGDSIRRALWRAFQQSLLEFKMCIPYDPSVPFLRISQRNTWPYANGQHPRKLSGLCLVETFNGQSVGSKEVKCGIISSGARRQRQAIPGSRSALSWEQHPQRVHTMSVQTNTHTKRIKYISLGTEKHFG